MGSAKRTSARVFLTVWHVHADSFEVTRRHMPNRGQQLHSLCIVAGDAREFPTALVCPLWRQNTTPPLLLRFASNDSFNLTK